MNLTLLDDADVKVVYDSQGVKREVLISYEKYEKILEFIERYAYFNSQEVQERLRKSDEDLQTGRYIEVGAVEVDKALDVGIQHRPPGRSSRRELAPSA